jgi:hypothetical protein
MGSGWRRAAAGRVLLLGALAAGLTVFAATASWGKSRPARPIAHRAHSVVRRALADLRLSFTGPPLGAAAVEKRYRVTVSPEELCGRTPGSWQIVVLGTGQRVVDASRPVGLSAGRAVTAMRYRWEVNGKAIAAVDVRLRLVRGTPRRLRLEPVALGPVSALTVRPREVAFSTGRGCASSRP